MKNNVQQFRGDSQGFTLVELAIVMIIIGILIGGILKGQELITNSRVTSTIAQFQALGAAKNDFQNQYNSIPGDMNNATTRLPNCTGACAVVITSNGALDVGVGGVGNEAMAFYGHLLAAGYITSMDGTAAATFGQGYPTAAIGGGFTVGQTSTAAVGFTGGELRNGIYVVTTGTAAVVASGNGNMSPVQASRVDTKLDDGMPATGSMVVDSANTNCRAGAPVAYNSSNINAVCSLAYRI